MSVTDRTRKVLWGRSGNRCAICKHELVGNATANDDESVVGDECHIISPQTGGPRYDPSYPHEKVDSYESLILLCRTHHKMVDDQVATFTPGILRQMKLNHDIWVSEKLSAGEKPRTLKLRRSRRGIPRFLSRMTTGKEVLDLVTRVMSYSMDHEELQSEEEVALVGGFFQTVRDLGDLSDDFEPVDRVSIAYRLTGYLHELEESGFLVFGGREVQLLEGGTHPVPSPWPIAIICVLRKGNRMVQEVSLDQLRKWNDQQGGKEQSCHEM